MILRNGASESVSFEEATTALRGLARIYPDDNTGFNSLLQSLQMTSYIIYRAVRQADTAKFTAIAV
ncbi:hypothetical protein CKA32_004342 [Geitlerinema sp. FC II]|nr:hypothetical protein CKA32_004342 [Geitlerinema sp. FC II]